MSTNQLPTSTTGAVNVRAQPLTEEQRTTRAHERAAIALAAVPWLQCSAQIMVVARLRKSGAFQAERQQ